MRIDVLGLQAFIAIADKGSFLAAADTLNLSQTALSHRIAKLEESIGVQLFSRTTRQLTVTSEGLSLLPRARHAIDDLEGALTDLKSLGELRKRQIVIGCVPSLASNMLPDLLLRFNEIMPDVRVRVFDGYATTIATLVHSGQVEFGLIVKLAIESGLTFKHLTEEGFVALCREDHELASRHSVTWKELAAYDLVGNSVINEALRNARSLVTWNYLVENIPTAASFVKRGLGVTIIPALETRRLHDEGFHTVPITDPFISRSVGIVTRPDMPPSRTASQLIQLIESHIQSLSLTERAGVEA